MSKRKTTNEFIGESKVIFNDKYGYDKTIYVNNHTKVVINCAKHGDFKVTPNDHLSKRSGCPICNNAGRIKNHNTRLIIKNKFKVVHGDKYNYDKVVYVGNDDKVNIICPFHGEFKQSPHHHLQGHGCPLCKNVKRKTTNEFIGESKVIFNDKYGYDKTIYVNNHTKVVINCAKHGDFKVTPNDHLSKRSGCPICKESKGELLISDYLKIASINYIRGKRFPNCKNIKTLPFDFYLPEHNTCIEFDGRQHYEPINFFGGKTTFTKIKLRDKIKTDYCEENGIRLIRIHYNDDIINELKKRL